MWACFLLFWIAMSSSTSAKADKYAEEFRDIVGGLDKPCSHETLQQTVHGVIYTRSCNDDTLVDSMTNRLLGMLPELKLPTFSIIVCSDAISRHNLSECFNSFYVAEMDMVNYMTFPNDGLTRKSLAALKSKFSITQLEPNYNSVNKRYRRQEDTTTGAMPTVNSLTPIPVMNTIPTAVRNTIPTAMNAISIAVMNTIPTAVMNTVPTAVMNTVPTAVMNTIRTAVMNTISTSLKNTIPTPVISPMATATPSLIINNIVTASSAIDSSTAIVTMVTTYYLFNASIITPSSAIASSSTTSDSSSITPPFAIESTIYAIITPSMVSSPSPFPSNVPGNQGPTDKSSNLSGLEEWHIAIISAVGLSAIFCLIFGLLISCFYIEKKSRQKHVGPYEHPSIHIAFDEENFELHPITPQITKKISRLSFRQPTPALSNLLSIEELKQMVDSERTDGEFLKLPPNTVTMEHVPAGAENKNRYIDILPNPRTRVALYLQQGVPTSDYINANYIRGYKMASKEYIATQGPLPHTINDFWRMIWEQRCTTIVMLTHCTENGRIKCEQYWPDERVNRTAVYGEFLVTLNTRQSESDYIRTTFSVQHQDRAVSRVITHFWYTSWPDHGVPDNTSPVIAFVMDVRNHHRECDIPAPIVVHCSAGIGRSGVFIASDIGMKQLEENGMVDVLKIVSTLRQDRGGMVQTVIQYQFLYKLLYDYGIYMQWISSAHLTGLQPVNEEFPNDTTDSEHVTDDEHLETDSQISLII